MAPGDKLLAALVLLFMAGLGLSLEGAGVLWLVLCLPMVIAIVFVGFAVWAADRFFKGLRLW